MPFFHFPFAHLHYFLKRNLTQLFLSLAIRSLAQGMVIIFEPIYLYLFFGRDVSLVLLFFGAAHGLYGLLAVYGGKTIVKIGLKYAILIGNLLFFSYFLFLYLLPTFSWLVTLALIARALAMMFFWPAFHTDFVRFSEKRHRGLEVGEMRAARIVPIIVAPLFGGWLVAAYGFSVLFVVVLVVYALSLLPLFFTKEVHEVYTDSYERAWQRIFKKENRDTTIALATVGIEVGINKYLWPVFLAFLAIGYLEIGGIASLGLALSAVFALYLGRVSDTFRKFRLLNIGALLSALAWLFKYFVTTPLEALLAHSFYRFSHVSADIPYSALFYEKAALKKQDADEFIIYRETVINLSRAFFFFGLAALFVFVSQINLAFILAALLSLGFVFMGRPLKLKR